MSEHFAVDGMDSGNKIHVNLACESWEDENLDECSPVRRQGEKAEEGEKNVKKRGENTGS